jgi:hypothetical protein
VQFSFFFWGVNVTIDPNPPGPIWAADRWLTHQCTQKGVRHRDLELELRFVVGCKDASTALET